MTKQRDKSKLINIRNEFDDEIDQKYNFDIQISSDVVHLSYLNLLKYSETIQDELKENYMKNILNKVQHIKNEAKVDDNNIKLFFKLLNEENVQITTEQFLDISKLANFFKVTSLQKYLKKYAEAHSEDVEFLICKIMESQKIQSSEFYSSESVETFEKCLSRKIEQCLSNQLFNKLPIGIIYRIIDHSDKSQIDSNLLYEFIMKDKSKNYILFQFLKLPNLSEKNFNNLYENYMEEKDTKTGFIYEYFANLLPYIKQLRVDMFLLQNKVKKLEKSRNKLRDELNDFEEENEQLKKKIIKLEKRDKKQIKSNDEKKVQKIKKAKEINLEENGILEYLKENYEINNEVKIIMPNESTGSVYNLLDFDYFSPDSNVFSIFSKPKQWIIYEFLNSKIFLTEYNLQLINKNKPKSWIVEGSVDLNNWVLLDEQIDIKYEFNHPNFTGPCKNQNKGPFKYIRVTQTDLNLNNSIDFTFKYIEFFGKIIIN